MNYDVNYFIDKFSKIPENQWCIGVLINNKGQKCAQGHLGIDNDGGCYIMWGMDRSNLEANAFYQLFPFVHPIQYTPETQEYEKGSIIAYINNGENPNYQQPTPKQRVLAALYDKKEQDKAVEQVNELLKEVPELV